MTFVIAKIAVLILGVALGWLGRRSLGRTARFLFSAHGPRTDVSRMSRQELFQSGRWFMGIGLVLLAAYALMVTISGNAISESALLLYLLFLLSFPGLMGLGGGLYLLVRGFFRRPEASSPDVNQPITPK
jgi:hypothetical protein